MSLKSQWETSVFAYAPLHKQLNANLFNEHKTMFPSSSLYIAMSTSGKRRLRKQLQSTYRNTADTERYEAVVMETAAALRRTNASAPFVISRSRKS